MQKQIEDITLILGNIIDPIIKNETWVCDKNNYEWYYTFGRLLQPTSILEIGVSRGYGSIAMGFGCENPPTHFFFVDNEIDGIPITTAIQNINQIFPNAIVETLIADSQIIESLPSHFIADVSHVDGCHTFGGVQKELALVYPCTRYYIIVDDTHGEYIANGVKTFVSTHNDIQIIHEITESLTGQMILKKSQPKKRN